MKFTFKLSNTKIHACFLNQENHCYIIDTHTIVDETKLTELDSVINRDEIELFRSTYLES